MYVLVLLLQHGVGTQEITLKLPGRGNKPLRTTIKEHAPWKLKQIQDSANYFQLAQEQYHEIHTNKEALRTPEQIRKAFDNLTGSLRQAEKVLVLPQLPTMQEIYAAEMRSHLKPELPEDIALHFHISSSRLVLTILTVTPAPKPGASVGVQSVLSNTPFLWCCQQLSCSSEI